MLNQVRSLLGREGYGVITATTIDEAVMLCEKSMPALCLIDNDFSHLENLRLVEILRVFDKKNNGKSAFT